MEVAASVNRDAISSLTWSLGMVLANRMTSTANFFVRAFRSSGVMPDKGARAVPVENQAQTRAVSDAIADHQSTIFNRITNQRSQNLQSLLFPVLFLLASGCGGSGNESAVGIGGDEIGRASCRERVFITV